MECGPASKWVEPTRHMDHGLGRAWSATGTAERRASGTETPDAREAMGDDGGLVWGNKKRTVFVDWRWLTCDFSGRTWDFCGMPQFLLKARWFFWWRNLRLKGSKAAEFPGELPNQILFAQISVKNQHEESESNLPNQHRRMSGMVGMVRIRSGRCGYGCARGIRQQLD